MPARRVRGLAAVVAFAALAAGCAPRTTVILLPEPDGKKTAVSVNDSRGEVVLDQPYAAVERDAFRTTPYTATPEEVQAKFGAALAAQPRREAKFVLHFAEGKDELTEESRALLDRIFAEIAARPVPDVLVIGHTDSTGTGPANDALARQRADTVRNELLKRGLAPANVQASGRGSREPVVPTAPGVAEPRNRRVEIIVR